VAINSKYYDLLGKYWNIFLNLIFPPVCYICSFPVESLICENCKNIITSNINLKSVNINSITVQVITKYQDPLKHVIWLVKFKNKKILIPFVQDLLINFIPGSAMNNFDLIIPVPIHKKRRKKRGFNQAEEFVKEYAVREKSQLITDCLVRKKETRSLYKLNKLERVQAISGSIKCMNPKLIKDKNVLLFDDILTSGATLNECAKVLLENGAAGVQGLAICRA
jgi:ComF family protein